MVPVLGIDSDLGRRAERDLIITYFVTDIDDRDPATSSAGRVSGSIRVGVVASWPRSRLHQRLNAPLRENTRPWNAPSTPGSMARHGRLHRPAAMNSLLECRSQLSIPIPALTKSIAVRRCVGIAYIPGPQRNLRHKPRTRRTRCGLIKGRTQHLQVRGAPSPRRC